MAQQRKSTSGLELLKLLSRRGYRIFDIETAKQFGPEVGITASYLRQALMLLKKNKWIIPLRNGLYGMDISFLGGIPLHEHEIGMFLVKPAAISYFSAFQYHGLTDQLPYVVFIKTTSNVTLPILAHKSPYGYKINGAAYKFTKENPDLFLGLLKDGKAQQR